MTTKRSAGFNNVSISIIELSIKYIFAEPLSHLVNNSFMNGLVPDALKSLMFAHILKVVTMLILLITGQYLFCRPSLKYLKTCLQPVIKLFISAVHTI